MDNKGNHFDLLCKYYVTINGSLFLVQGLIPFKSIYHSFLFKFLPAVCYNDINILMHTTIKQRFCLICKSPD